MKVKDVALSARQIKAGPDDGLGDGVFTAYASVFGNKDSYGDVVVKGAFADDLKEWDESGQNIPLLFGHNMSDPDFNLGHVVDAKEDDHGLLVTAQLDLENPKAAQVYRMLKGKRINQMSFAYDVIEAGEAERDVDGVKEHVYELRKLKTYEVSVVTIGANQETEVLAVKSAAGALLSKAGRVLSAKNEATIKAARTSLAEGIEALDDVLSVIGQDDDQEKASDDPEAKADAGNEEPAGAKLSAPVEEPKGAPSARDLAASKFRIYASAYAGEEGV